MYNTGNVFNTTGLCALIKMKNVMLFVFIRLKIIKLYGRVYPKEERSNRIGVGFPKIKANLKNGTGFKSNGAQMVKGSACDAGDLLSTPGLQRSPGEGNGNPLHYSWLENPMDKGAWQATYSPWGHTTKQLTLPLSLPRMMKKQPSKKKKRKRKNNHQQIL